MRRHKLSTQLISLAVLLSFASLSCRSGGGAAAQPTEPSKLAPSEQVLLQLKDLPPGLQIRLSDGKPGLGHGEAVKQAAASKLSDGDAQRLFARLPALVGDKDDQKAFALRDRSQPAPQTGNVIKDRFPGPPSNLVVPAVDDAARPLQVTRFMPEGEVPLAPNLSVSFSHPMVPITSHADTIAQGVPVTLVPEPKGHWRWIGTKTLLFDPDPRFPAATEYTATIKAGTRSQSGAVLKEDKVIKFATPAPVVQGQWPTYGPQRRDTLVFVSFDQAIDRAKVLPHIKLNAAGDSIGVVLASEEEIRKNPSVKALVDGADQDEHAGRYLVVKPARLLPYDTDVFAVVERGTPSAEGPRTTPADQSFSFRTFGPLKVVESYCSYGTQCPPGTPWSIRFSNPLDEEAFDPAALDLDPALPGLKTQISGEWLSIFGRSKGRTQYQVTLPATLKDSFEQTLGKEETLRFHVGDAYPQLYGPSGLTLADPAAKTPTYDLHSINVKSLDVQLYKVEPADWPKYVKYMEKNSRRPLPPPGKRVVNTRVKLTGSVDDLSETHIDLQPALNSSGHGHVVIHIEPSTWPEKYKPEIDAWVEATDLAIDAFVDSSEMTAWATQLGDGTPVQGVGLEMVPHAIKATTSAKGLATLALPQAAPAEGAHQLLVAKQGDDVAFLPESTYSWSNYGGWHRTDLGQTLSWFVFDDRQMYRPGEEVHLKGWIRTYDANENGDVGGVNGQVTQVSYKVTDPRGNEIGKGQAKVNALGGFDTSFKLPGTPNLGYASVSFTANGRLVGGSRDYLHSFQIQEFRRPEFEVTSTASQGPFTVGGSADVTVKAAYYAGGGLPNADVQWSVMSTPTSFSPAGHDDYTFGVWTPWWTYRYSDVAAQGATKWDQFQGKTDGAGQHILHMDFVSVNPARPMSVVAEAHVADVNRQSWASSTTLLVHPSKYYVGLKQDRYFVDQGKPIEVQGILTDQDGKLVAGQPIAMKAVRLDWTYKKGEYQEEEVDPQTCAKPSTQAPIQCSFPTPEGGTYRVTATVVDELGRPNETQILVWVSGGDVPPARNVELQEVTLVPSAKTYAPGDTALVLVQAPFYPATALMSIRRSGIVRTESFQMTGPSTTIKVPITEAEVPNLTVQIDLVGSTLRSDDDGQPAKDLPRRPAYAKGAIDLPIPPRSRTLEVKVVPRAAKLEPGGSTSVDLAVKDALGRPVSGAELAVVVVDESVLALTGYATPNPLAYFYGERPAGGTDYYIRQYVQLARPDAGALAGNGYGPGGVTTAVTGSPDDSPREAAGMAEVAQKPAPTTMRNRAEKKDGGRYEADEDGKDRADAGGNSPSGHTPIAVRKDWNALAVFSPAVRTDGAGRASVAVKVPDNLTRYRVMAVAVAGDKQFGSGESNITARMPLMVRPSPPRFLNFGDTFELPIVLQNQTDQAMQVDVAVRAANAKLTDGSGRRVTVPANDRVEVRLPSAAALPGTARFQIGAQSGRFTDAAEVALPVWTPATTEAFATYGELDKGAVRQAIAMPEDVVKEYGQLEVETSSTQLQALTDAFLYLVQYPYECAEQTSSRILAVAALRDVLTAFRADGLPDKATIEKTVARDLERLHGLQNYDGGFAFWERDRESWPYISIHAGHALIRAKQKGYPVPAEMLAQNHSYLQDIESHIPAWYPLDVRRALIAYSLYVRKLMGDADAKQARALIADAGLKHLSMDAIGWLLFTLSGDKASASEIAEIHKYLGNRVSETSATANWTTDYADGNYLILHSDRRADAIILEALIEDSPKDELIAKVVRGLLAHQKRGRWENTQENSFVLLAMDRYFHVYEKLTPNFVSRMWLGGAFAGAQSFKGRSTDKHQLDVPMSYVADMKKGDLIIDKQGQGRLYYRIGMTYAPKSLRLDPADHGFTVTRRYEGVDDPKDVQRMADGSWKVKAGKPVRVRLTMVAENRRYHVALVDPLPAGLEPLNPALAVTGTIPQDPDQQKQGGAYWWWYRTWYEHQNLRDERVEAFTSLLWEGVWDYTYVTRATTPGSFVVPPAKAEEMYFPETFGRSGSDRVVVE